MRRFHEYQPEWRCVFHLRDDGYPTENIDLPKWVKVLTVVVLFDKNGVIASGGAACNREDQWNRKVGIAIAEGRAKKAMTQALAGKWETTPEPWRMGIWPKQTQDKLLEAQRIVNVIHGYLMGKLMLSKGGGGETA